MVAFQLILWVVCLSVWNVAVTVKHTSRLSWFLMLRSLSRTAMTSVSTHRKADFPPELSARLKALLLAHLHIV